MLTAVALGFVLGLRHALDPDHLVAVSALVARNRSPWTASWLGASWGLGHATTLLAVGALLIALRVTVPESFTLSFEVAVGALLVLLGVANLAAAAGSNAPLAGTEGPRLRKSLARSGIVGLVHGLAGSGAVVLLASAAMPDAATALVYLAIFGVGTMAGMVAFSLLLGAPLAALGEGAAWQRLASAATGIVSLLFGTHLIHSLLGS